MKKGKNFIKRINKQMDKEQINKYIYIVFALIIFLTPIIPEVYAFGYTIKSTIFNMVTIVTSALLLLINFKELIKHITVWDYMLFTYLLLIILSCVFSNYSLSNTIFGSNGRAEGVITLFGYMVTFCIFCKGYRYTKGLLKYAIMASMVVCIYSIVQANLPNGYDWLWAPTHLTGVATGTMRNQNFLSSYICIFLPMVIYWYINTKPIKNIVPVILLFLALVYSKTLGGYLTFICMLLGIITVSLIYTKNRREQLIRIGILILSLIVVFTLITIFANDSYLNELSSTKTEVKKLEDKSESFGSERMAIWKKAIKIVENNKYFGVGPDCMLSELTAKRDIYLCDGTKDILNRVAIDKAHSEPLQIAVTTGIPSLIIYSIFIIYSVYNMLRLVLKKQKEYICMKDYNKAKDNERIYVTMIFLGVISYLAQALINVSVVQVAPIFWGILGLGVGSILHEKS